MEENVKKYVVLKKLIQHLRIFHITIPFRHRKTGCYRLCTDRKSDFNAKIAKRDDLIFITNNSKKQVSILIES